MAAFDGSTQRRKGFVHDWLPLIVVAVLCVLVVTLDVKL